MHWRTLMLGLLFVLSGAFVGTYGAWLSATKTFFFSPTLQQAVAFFYPPLYGYKLQGTIKNISENGVITVEYPDPGNHDRALYVQLQVLPETRIQSAVGFFDGPTRVRREAAAPALFSDMQENTSVVLSYARTRYTSTELPIVTKLLFFIHQQN